MRKFIAIAALALLGACAQVDDNEIGLKRVYGEIQDTPVRGFTWYNPWSTDIITFDNQQTKIESEAQVPTHDQQVAHIKSTTQVQLAKAGAANMYRNVGAEWANAIVPQLVKSVQNSEFGRIAAIGAIQQQANVEQAIRAKLTELLRARGITLMDYQLTEVHFSEEYTKAVEQKATAVQTAEGEKNKTVAIQERAKQRIITANAEAEAMRVQAQALESNKSLTQYEAVKKWDGRLPTYMMGSSTPFIQIDKQ